MAGQEKTKPGTLPSKMVIGLIGGIGSGKSLVANEMVRRGGYLISGDSLGHEALEQPEILTRVKDHWGSEVISKEGKVDRRKLGAKVFADAHERKILENLVFPFIEMRLIQEIAAAKKDPRSAFIVLDAAVMLEAGWNKSCDRLVYVEAPRELRLERLASHRGLTEKEVTQRENAQWPLTEKRKRADAILDNSGPTDRMIQQVDQLLAQWGVVKPNCGVTTV